MNPDAGPVSPHLGASPDGPEPGVAALFRRLDGCADEGEARAIVDALVRALGFTFFSYAMPCCAAEPERAAEDGMGLTTYPEAWRALYRRRRYHAEDAVLLRGRDALRPFRWGDEDHLRGLEPSARRPFFAAKDFGIESGIAVPVRGPGGAVGLFSVSGPEPRQAAADVGLPAFHALVTLAGMVHALAVERRAPAPESPAVRLSERERLCLHWTTQGKTAWEVAQIIGRSKATVDFHLRRATGKLEASNKVHAAFKAREMHLL